jgi:hypothetical protein
MSPQLAKFGMDFNGDSVGKYAALFEKFGKPIDVMIEQFASGNDIQPKL